jgi:hypothetical protein
MFVTSDITDLNWFLFKWFSIEIAYNGLEIRNDNSESDFTYSGADILKNEQLFL